MRETDQESDSRQQKDRQSKAKIRENEETFKRRKEDAVRKMKQRANEDEEETVERRKRMLSER